MQAQNILNYINHYRKNGSKSSLAMDRNMSILAEFHCRFMANQARLSHDLWNLRYNQLKESYLGNIKMWSATENVAMTNPNFSNPVDLWCKSDAHNKNLLSDSNYAGVGYYKDADNNHWVTVIFARIA